MKKYLLFILIFAIVVILGLFVGLYFSIFNSKLSFNNSDWGDFGDYIAGTIGICFTLISIILIYLTFFEQRKQQFETTFQQYVSNYYSLLNLINENWLHNSPIPEYRKGREIFGNAIGYIKTNDEKNTFIKIFGIHNNVFQHYCGHIIELFKIIDNNNELKKETKENYIQRFLSMLSTYELIFIAYYIECIFPNKNRNDIKENLKSRLSEIIITDSMPFIEQIRYIINKYQ